MIKRTLFIGWGNVVREYYWEHLRPYYENGTMLPVIAETPEKAGVIPGIAAPWGGREIDGLIKKGVFNRIFILTPPSLHMEQLRHCLGLLRDSRSSVTIYIEKPVDTNLRRARSTVTWVRGLKRPASWSVRQIDHYAQKWCSRWIRAHQRQVASLVGPIKEIVFISYETALIDRSLSFKQGYAREHGTHAWAMINHCFPELADPRVHVQLAGAPSSWRYTDCPAVCMRESAFLITYRLQLPAGRSRLFGETVLVTIAAGKALQREVKQLTIKGPRVGLTAFFNKDRINAITARGAAEIGRTQRDISKQPAYKTIIDAIYTERNANAATSMLEDGLLALERIEMAAKRFGKLRNHKKRTTPVELARVVVDAGPS